ncbi:ABC transporter ATP-binding protein [Bacillus pseudomycoides]|uniref:ABC transporter ATP-binding protein n=1 Tax=Bacillus pseudomycoides TaxID=64104 RepID=UPI000BEFBF55|nr:ABC transporter ATP-binding protein [Bacillus pseudomycoides]PEJ33174.1 ABC transporter ATP-binding protein [Bacillus pseudomycoides]PHA95732.1 ABC transporter ATP-binding protein [Bacillus pseudomycoides]PHC74061.1 ABC transporter ATP-binding protein [Bacillus pseudomycoides]
MYAIEVDNLVKIYGDKKVVNGVNLKIKKGIIFGFVGVNGAGKSTFINMLTGIINPSSGSFRVLGVDYLKLDNIKKKIGVLPDYSSLYNNLTALQHLDYFCKILSVKKTKNDLIDILNEVGLGNDVNKKVKNFSFGMKKKLGIAQSLVNDPELIFLDEPTSGVDASSVLNIHSVIKNLSNSGVTVFLTSHNLDEVEKICDEIAIMKNGTISCNGTMDNLRKRYQNSILVKIKHSLVLDDTKELINDIFKNVGRDIKWDKGNLLYITIDNEESISHLTKTLDQFDVNVYRIEVNEPSLEEIFLASEKEFV